jgi:hypothetical protein
MPTKRTPELQELYIKYLRDNPQLGPYKLAELIKAEHPQETPAQDSIRRALSEYKNTINLTGARIITKDDKKVGVTDWREWNQHLIERQELHEKASFSQSTANIEITTDYKYIILMFLADLHIGSIAADYKLLQYFTDYILSNPNIRVILAGDMIDNFVNFRNVLAMHQQILSPAEQDSYFESWLKELNQNNQILLGTWGNHEEFEERVSGRNIIKRILQHNVIYMNGICSANLTINGIMHELAGTHKTRYNSSFNPLHGLMQMSRNELPEADIYFAGDTHNAAIGQFFIQGKTQTFIKMGTLKTNDGYSKRYFSPFTSAYFPGVVLRTDVKAIQTYSYLDNVTEYLSK